MRCRSLLPVLILCCLLSACRAPAEAPESSSGLAGPPAVTADPVKEVSAGIAILKAAGLRPGGVRFVSCPTCGRTEIDLIGLAAQVESRVKDLDRDITVAVMGCAVNGPGEAREADYGVAGGKGKGLLFKKGQVLGTYPYDRLCDALMERIEKDVP